jgi:hypothetical protein
MAITVPFATDEFIGPDAGTLSGQSVGVEAENVWAAVMDAVYVDQEARRTLYQQTRYPRTRRHRHSPPWGSRWTEFALGSATVLVALLTAIGASDELVVRFPEPW